LLAVGPVEDDAGSEGVLLEEARMEKTRIVVGASGSPASSAAVRWAATEARLRGAELRVVVAYHRGRAGEAETAGIVHDAVVQARSAAPGVPVAGVALPGYAVPVLLKAAEGAALLVVGERGGGVLAGAVGGQVATGARSSVAVVRGRADRSSGPVVACVDEDTAADAVLGRAFEEAALRGAEILAVTAGDSGPGGDARLDPWRARYRSVPAQREYVAGKPGKVLVATCREARLAVVGPRRHGYPGVMLGAVGSRLLHGADCPVLIAR
jgi:nucleotide-binding universal stress UspA family protein